MNGLAEPLPLAAELSTVGVPIPYERDEARELAIEKLQILGRVMDGGLTERLTGITQLVTKLLNVQFAAVTLVYKGGEGGGWLVENLRMRSQRLEIF